MSRRVGVRRTCDALKAQHRCPKASLPEGIAARRHRCTKASLLKNQRGKNFNDQEARFTVLSDLPIPIVATAKENSRRKYSFKRI